LLTAEMGLVDAEFYLVFLGVAALCVGLLGLSGIHAPVWLQWLLFAVLALGSLVLFRKRVYQKMRGAPGEDVPENVEAALAVCVDAIAPGARGVVELRGSRWTAQNTGEAALAPGEHARVVRAEGVVLHVRAER